MPDNPPRPDAIARLIAEEALPAGYARQVEQWWRPLAATIAGWRAAAGRPIVVGVNGAQGSGKSTLCRFLEAALLPELGLRAMTVALDDFYLPAAARRALARDVHRLLATRGVPGTHDVAAGIAAIAALARGDGGTVALPRFDKARDDRAATVRTVTADADVVLFEGWCVGAVPQPDAALDPPVNALERAEDADGRWRRHVNAALGDGYVDWFAAIDRLVLLRVPGFDAVLANRRLQECKLRARGGGGMDDAAVERFVAHYERMTRHILAEMPRRADLVFDLDDEQQVVRRSTPT